jgi:hypothetical protein
MIAHHVVVVSGADGREIWHPHEGRIEDDVRWAGHTLLTHRDGQVQRLHLAPWTEASRSRLALAVRLTIDEEGQVTGTLAVRASGLWCAGQQRQDEKHHLGRLLGQLLPGVKVTEVTVTGGEPDGLAADGKLELPHALPKLHGCYRLELGTTSPAHLVAPVPLEPGRRETPLRLTGALDERVGLDVSWPDGWTVRAVPAAVAEVATAALRVSQDVERREAGLRLKRRLDLEARDLPSADAARLRDVLLELQAPSTRTLLLEP